MIYYIERENKSSGVELRQTLRDLKMFSRDSRLAPTTFLSLSVLAVAARLSTVLLVRNCSSSACSGERKLQQTLVILHLCKSAPSVVL